MRKLGNLRAMSIKAGDLIKINGYCTVVTEAKTLPCGYVWIETEMFTGGEYFPTNPIGIYSRY